MALGQNGSSIGNDRLGAKPEAGRANLDFCWAPKADLCSSCLGFPSWPESAVSRWAGNSAGKTFPRGSASQQKLRTLRPSRNSARYAPA